MPGPKPKTFVVIDEVNYLHGASTEQATYADKYLTGREFTDLVLHETLESLNGFNDDVTLEKQAKFWGVTAETRRDTDNQMGKTREAMAESRKPKLEQVQAAQKKASEEKMASIPKEFEDVEEDKMTSEQKQKLEAVLENAGVDRQLIESAGAKGSLEITQNLLAQRLQPLRDGYSAAIRNMRGVVTTEQTNLVNALSASLQDRQTVAFSAQVAQVKRQGKLVPSSLITPLVEPLATAKDNALTIYGLTPEQKGAFEACVKELEKVYSGVSKKIVLSTEDERGLMREYEVEPEAFSVVCRTDEVNAELKDQGVFYVPIDPTHLEQDKLNGLNVFIFAASKGLSEQAQAIMQNLNQNDIRNVEQLTIADDEQYENFKREYEKFVDLFIQA